MQTIYWTTFSQCSPSLFKKVKPYVHDLAKVLDLIEIKKFPLLQQKKFEIKNMCKARVWKRRNCNTKSFNNIEIRFTQRPRHYKNVILRKLFLCTFWSKDRDIALSYNATSEMIMGYEQQRNVFQKLVFLAGGLRIIDRKDNFLTFTLKIPSKSSPHHTVLRLYKNILFMIQLMIVVIESIKLIKTKVLLFEKRTQANYCSVQLRCISAQKIWGFSCCLVNGDCHWDFLNPTESLLQGHNCAPRFTLVRERRTLGWETVSILAYFQQKSTMILNRHFCFENPLTFLL